jgi:outer membrane protein OmpA-like peptidoglycan-associated protein
MKLQSEINNVLSTNKITFERRSTKITKDSFDSVKKIADILNDNINIKVEIGGHTDSRGAASLNKRISQDRANSVMNALIDLGIEKSRLTAVGYGEDFPIAKDDKNGLSEVNRRVEIKVLGE